MKDSLLVISLVINVIICIGIPLGVFIYILVKKRNYLKSYVIGALVFFITQICLRLPLINNVMVKFDSFNIFKSFYPVTYIIFLGITAGVFEECGRYIGFKLTLKKHRRFGDGVAFALGHGGIEALLIAGISSLYNLIILLNLNLGNDNGTILGMDANEAMIAFNSVNNISVLTIGLERILAMVIHLGLTMIVLYGIKFSKKHYLLIAIALHAIVDVVVAFIGSIMGSLFWVEVWCLICAIIFIIITIKIKEIFYKEV